MSYVPKSKRPHQRDPWLIIAKRLNVSIEQAKKCMQDQGCFATLVDRVSQSSVQLHEQDYWLEDYTVLYCTVLYQRDKQN